MIIDYKPNDTNMDFITPIILQKKIKMAVITIIEIITIIKTGIEILDDIEGECDGVVVFFILRENKENEL